MRFFLLSLVLFGCADPDVGVNRSSLLEDGPWRVFYLGAYTPRGGGGADGSAWGDVDGDGVSERVVAWESGRSVTIHRPFDLDVGSSTPLAIGMPWAVEEAFYDANRPIEGVRIGNLDSDLHQDIVASSVADGSFPIILWGDGGSTWTSMELPSPAPSGNRWLNVTIADINGDGRSDVCGQPQTRLVFCWYQPATNPRTASNWTGGLVAYAKHVMDMPAVDMDGDGDLDLVVSQRLSSTSNGVDASWDGLWWAENGTSGGPSGTWTRHWISADADLEAMGSCVGPNGEIAQTYWRDGFEIYTDDGSGGWDSVSISIPSGLPASPKLKDCVWADFDEDGDFEIYVSAEEQAALWRVTDWDTTPVWERLDFDGWGQTTKVNEITLCDPQGATALCIEDEGGTEFGPVVFAP